MKGESVPEVPVVEILTKARELLNQPGAWTQEAYARDPHGHALAWDEEGAICFCSIGALNRVSSGIHAHPKVFKAFCRAIEADDIAHWNDTVGRTQSQVLAAFDKAIELAIERAP